MSSPLVKCPVCGVWPHDPCKYRTEGRWRTHGARVLAWMYRAYREAGEKSERLRRRLEKK